MMMVDRHPLCEIRETQKFKIVIYIKTILNRKGKNLNKPLAKYLGLD